MKGRRFFTALGIFLVTIVAGAISYRHQSELALHNGQPQVLAAIWPACVDGLVMSCGIAIATDRAGGFKPRPWALVGFWVGVVVSVLTNWLATNGGPIAHAISAFPAIAFLIAVESLSSKPRAPKKSQGEPVIAPNVNTINSEPLADLDTETRHAVSDSEPPKSAKPRATRNDSARDRVLKTASRMKDPTPARIAVNTGLAEATVRKHLRTANPTTGTSEPDSAGVQLDGNNEPVAEPINGHSFADASI